MLFFVISVVFVLIGITAFRGDYEEKERKKDREEYRRIVYGRDD